MIRRALWAIPVMLGVSLLVFSIMKLVPGDAAEAMVGIEGSAEEIEAMRESLGLDEPVYVQYGRFVKRLVLLDLGDSTTSRQPVTDEIRSRIRPTVELAIVAFLLASLVGIVTGVVAATHQNSIWDALATIYAVLGVSMPIYWFGLMLMLLFSVKLGWLPATGSGSFKQLILPAIALGSASTAIISRQTRSSMLEVLRQDYIRTARAKGLAERLVIYRHALRNAMIPTVTVAGLQVGFLLGGSVLTETVFARPGIGSLLVQSINTRDVPVIQGTIMMLAVLFVVINLIVDLLYVKLDPRISYK